MTELFVLLAAPLLGRLLLGRRLRLLLPRSAPRRRLGFLFVEGNGTGAKARDGDEITRSDPEPDSESQEHREARVPLSRLDLSKKSLGTATRCGPFEREARQVPGGSDVLANQFQEAFGVHPRDFAISLGSALAHSRVPYFLVDRCSGWRCTWATMGGFPP